jgi:hypothetical protein
MDKTGLVMKNVISDQITIIDRRPKLIPSRRSAHGRRTQNVYHSKIEFD